MDIESIYEELLQKIGSSKVLRNESMKKHTSFKIGGNADILVKAKNIEDIKRVLEVVNKNNISLYLIGNGTNILVKDKGIRGIVLKIDIKTYNITKKENIATIKVGSGVKLSKLAYDLQKQGIQGFEFASRNTRYNWRSSIYECRGSWKRDEKYSSKYNIHGLSRKNKYYNKQTAKIFL